MKRYVKELAIASEAAVTPIDESADFQRDNVFMLYASFCGDVDRTAHATQLSPDEVRALALAGSWDTKLKPIIELRKSQKQDDVERAINRALNFVQAHRMRKILEATIRRISAMTPDELTEATTMRQIGKDGEVIRETLSTRPLADLASALEKCHALTYMALNDTATERKARPEASADDLGASEIHAKLAAAFAKDGKAVSQG